VLSRAIVPGPVTPRAPYSDMVCQRSGMTSTSRPDGGRRGLQIVLGTLSAIPFASGLAGVLVGPRSLPGDNTPVTANVDSEYRYAHALWFAVAPILWATLPHVERETNRLRSVSGAVFFGGLGRVAALAGDA
jgi:hypothetical protein